MIAGSTVEEVVVDEALTEAAEFVFVVFSFVEEDVDFLFVTIFPGE